MVSPLSEDQLALASKHLPLPRTVPDTEPEYLVEQSELPSDFHRSGVCPPAVCVWETTLTVDAPQARAPRDVGAPVLSAGLRLALGQLSPRSAPRCAAGTAEAQRSADRVDVQCVALALLLSLVGFVLCPTRAPRGRL